MQHSAECAQVVDRALQDAEMKVEDIDWLVLHQANQRILDSAAERLKVPPSRVVSNLARYGNTSAGSIPLALDEAVRAGSIAAGSTVPPANLAAPAHCLRHWRHPDPALMPPQRGVLACWRMTLQPHGCMTGAACCWRPALWLLSRTVLQVAFAGFGAGLTWASAIMRWQ